MIFMMGCSVGEVRFFRRPRAAREAPGRRGRAARRVAPRSQRASDPGAGSRRGSRQSLAAHCDDDGDFVVRVQREKFRTVLVAMLDIDDVNLIRPVSSSMIEAL